MKTESCAHSTITLAGQRFRVCRDDRDVIFIDNDTVEAFIERMTLQRRTDVLRDLDSHAVMTETLDRGSPQQTSWGLHQARARAN